MPREEHSRGFPGFLSRPCCITAAGAECAVRQKSSKCAARPHPLSPASPPPPSPQSAGLVSRTSPPTELSEFTSTSTTDAGTSAYSHHRETRTRPGTLGHLKARLLSLACTCPVQPGLTARFLPGAGEGVATNPKPPTRGDSCGMSSLPSGPTLPCLCWKRERDQCQGVLHS